MNGSWTEPDVRDELVDYVRYWSDRTQIKADKMVNWIGITHSKYYDWRCRYGKVNEHNAWIPRDFWLADWEKQEIIAYGVMKLKQDEMIFDMYASGIPSIIICPSNISGPYSVYMLGAIQNLSSVVDHELFHHRGRRGHREN